jgi:hypothetical protein
MGLACYAESTALPVVFDTVGQWETYCGSMLATVAPKGSMQSSRPSKH